MKSYRVIVLLAVIVIALAALRFWPKRSASQGAATPEECVESYYESLKAGEVAKYLRHLGEPYRTDAGQRFFAAACRDVKEVKSLVQKVDPNEGGSSRTVDVEEVRTAGVRRLRYHLRQDESGWVIVGIDPPRETTSPIRYGTPVSDEP